MGKNSKKGVKKLKNSEVLLKWLTSKKKKKKKNEKKMYVVICKYHTDCYKRPETYNKIVGIYKTSAEAYNIALMHQVEDCMDYINTDEDEKAWNEELEWIAKNCATSENAFRTFNRFDWLPEPEFTDESDGNHYYVKEMTYSRHCILPVSNILKFKLD